MKSFSQGLFWNYSAIFFSNLASIFLQFISLIVITRILGPEGFGRFSLFLVIANLITLFGITWTSASVVRYGSEEFLKEKKLSKVFWARNIILFPCLLIFLVGTYVLRDRVMSYIGIGMQSFWFLMLYILSITFLDYLRYIQQAIGQFKMYASTIFLERLMTIVGLCGIVVGIFPKHILTVIGSYIVADILVVVIFLCFLKWGYFFPIEFNREYIKKIFFFSYPIIAGSVSSYIVNWIDIIVIKKYMDISQVGIYSLSYRGMSVLQTIIISTITLLNPLIIGFFVEKREDLIVKFIKKIIPQGLLLWAYFLSLMIFLSFYLIPKIFGQNFFGSIMPFSILMIGLTLNFLSCFYSPILTTYELIKQSMGVNVLMALINLAGDFVLVPKIGINGAAVATSFSYSFGAIFSFYIANKRLQLKEWKQLLSVMPIFFSMFMLLFPNSVWVRTVVFIGITIGTLIFAKTFRVFSHDDVEMFKKINMPAFLYNLINKIYNVILSR